MNDPLAFLNDTAKHWLDAGAVFGTLASIFGWVPGITAVVMLIWALMRLYECWLNIRLKRRELGE